MSNKKVLKTPSIGVAGFFTCEVLKDNKVIRSLPKFQNLILDQGLDYLGQGQTRFTRNCYVGTGTAVPLVSDTSLGNTLGSEYPDNYTAPLELNDVDRYIYSTITYIFDYGSIVGDIAEIGIGNDASNNALFSKSLIKDENGDPTIITLSSSEQLRVIYEYRVYQPQASIFDGVVGIYTIAGKTANADSLYSWYMRHGINPSQIERNCFQLGGGSIKATDGSVGATIIDEPTGTIIADTNASGEDSAYIPGSFTRDFTKKFTLNEANSASGISALLITYGPTCFQFSITPSIIKTEIENLDITFRYTWARKATPL